MANEPPDFVALLEYLKDSRGFDFSAYKQTSLARRIQNRMELLGLTGFAEYQGFLEANPNEFDQLFNAILINVTCFFRDPASWEYVGQQIVPQVIARTPASQPIRVWSAACATGEEAYTLAMVLCEALGEEAFRERVKIYATDADEAALCTARQAIYDEKTVADVPDGLREKYFDRTNGRFVFRKEIRRSVIFGRHDLLQDAPISRVDVLVCRNALMYLTPEGQARVLSRFYFAMNDRSFLFLGRAEMLLTHAHYFTPVELRHRVFQQAPRASMRERIQIMGKSGREEGSQLPNYLKLRETAFECDPVPRLVLDATGMLVAVNERARSVFRLAPRDVGRSLRDLDILSHPADLAPLIDRACVERTPIIHRTLDWKSNSGENQCYDLYVIPLTDSACQFIGTQIMFQDVSRYKGMSDELQQARLQVSRAMDELESTNEELETTNEELRSSVEELETTNEELQSTNEELETMNEEFQSTNEELEAVNQELRSRSEESSRLNAFLEAILREIRGGVIVLDHELRVLIWNERSEDLWGLRGPEVMGRHFLNLDIGLPADPLRDYIRKIQVVGSAAPAEFTLSATNRRGKSIQCRVNGSSLGGRDKGQGIILMVEEVGSETGGS